jgi:hypothetical protein
MNKFEIPGAFKIKVSGVLLNLKSVYCWQITGGSVTRQLHGYCWLNECFVS